MLMEKIKSAIEHYRKLLLNSSGCGLHICMRIAMMRTFFLLVRLSIKLFYIGWLWSASVTVSISGPVSVVMSTHSTYYYQSRMRSNKLI